ncbi:zinc-binding dehydrogenase [Kineobactrum sediminis]|uniref:Zinc-binding dehydrogenase n=1 Tax=Kineobactrum sediminis TaxID=1905677 RepID=A0A2N5Y5I9_9GAMM|nr:medium chain dehydrogenase/reductase family protein [Kineobactrum sediminis]PLW83631.1 zinc-binding dehydrogenase [Kineobactrum sediminis]
MKATNWQRIELTAFGGPENLKVVTEQQLPEPGPGQVRVKVLTAGTGFTDTVIRQGQYPGVKQKPPFTLGYDWFGMVDGVGSGVSTLQPGDYVADMPVTGGYSQYLLADAERIIPCPAGLEPAQAVCMILSYTTAYQMLTRECALTPGDRILVHAAGGAVGTAFLELARELELTVYGTASAAKHELVRSLGATPIDYRTTDFVAEISRLTDGQGVQAVFDTIGGHNWPRSYRCVARRGKLVGFGALQVTTGEESIPSLLWGFAKLLGFWRLRPDGRATGFYNIQSRREKHPEEFREDVMTLLQWLREGRLHPAVAEVRPLAEAADVHRLIDAGAVAGKIVLDCQA